MNPRFANGTRTASSTDDQVIFAGRAVLFGIYPELTTTGTITVADNATVSSSGVKHVAAIGLAQAGLTFGPYGVIMEKGIVVDQSVATDRSLVVWSPLP